MATDDDPELIASSLSILIQDQDLQSLRQTLLTRSLDVRKSMVNFLLDGSSVFYTACRHSNVEMVDFLLEECGSDIEQKGKYYICEADLTYDVPPLWAAACDEELDIVKTLVAHGADVNNTSSTGSTPLRSVCVVGNEQIVKFLVESGTDINKPNQNGVNCVMSLVRHEDLCEYMIMKGGNVNVQCKIGKTPLHYAAKDNLSGTVSMLIKHGANFRLKDIDGVNALERAAVDGQKEIVEVIVNEANVGGVERRDIYKLLGSYYAQYDTKHDLAIQAWRIAITEPSDCQPAISSYSPPLEVTQLCKGAKEYTSSQDLDKLSGMEDFMYQGMLIMERIFGTLNEETAYYFMYCGAVLADNGKYNRCLDIWTYTYRQRLNACSKKLVDTAQSIACVLWEFLEVGTNQKTDEVLCFPAVINIATLLLQHVHTLMKESQEISDPSGTKIVLQVFLHLVHLVDALTLYDEDKEAFNAIVRQMVSANPRCENSLTLLHLAIDPSSSVVDGDFISEFPAPAVVMSLIACGSDIFATTDDGSNVLDHAQLHLAAGINERQVVVTNILTMLGILLLRLSIHNNRNDNQVMYQNTFDDV